MRPELWPRCIPSLDALARRRAPPLDPERRACAATCGRRPRPDRCPQQELPREGRPRFECSRCSCSVAAPTSRSRSRAKLVARRGAHGRARGAQARSAATPPRPSCAPRARRAVETRRVRRHRLRRRTRRSSTTTFDASATSTSSWSRSACSATRSSAEHDAAAALEIVQTNFTGVVSVTVPLVATTRGRRATARSCCCRRSPANGCAAELRLRLVEGRRRRVLPGPRLTASPEPACTS